MRDEIQAGLKNALERGSSLEEAVQSFISAGYNPVEVKDAASTLAPGTLPITQADKPANNSAVKNMNNPSMDSNVMKTFTTQQPFSQFSGQKPFQSQNSQSQVVAPSNPVNPAGELQPKSSKKKWIIIVIVLLVLIVGIVGLLLFSNNLLDLFLSKL